MTTRQIMMHPQQASRRIALLEKELEEALEEGRLARMQAEQQAETLREEVAQARGETSRAMEQLDDLRKKHESLKKQAAKEMQRNASLFSDRQSEIEELKAGYERRLEHLRHALADARALLAERMDYDALRQMTVIDMTPKPNPAPKAAPKAVEKPVDERPEKSTDWLEPLPD